MRSAVVAVLLLCCAGSAVSAACKMSQTFPTYKQCDSSWGGINMGSANGTTICKAGCLMSSVASGMAGFGRKLTGGVVPNPKTFNAWLQANGGYSGNLYVWGAVSAPYTMSYQGQSDQISVTRDSICKGLLTVLNVNNGGHWVLALGFDGDTFTVMDPGYSRTTYTAGEVVRSAAYKMG